MTYACETAQAGRVPLLSVLCVILLRTGLPNHKDTAQYMWRGCIFLRVIEDFFFFLLRVIITGNSELMLIRIRRRRGTHTQALNLLLEGVYHSQTPPHNT